MAPTDSFILILFYLIPFLLFSIVWIVDFFFLRKHKDGLRFFFKQYILCIIVCALIATSLVSFSLVISTGLEIILYIYGTLGLVSIIYFIWSIVVFFRGRRLIKELDGKHTSRFDILDDL